MIRVHPRKSAAPVPDHRGQASARATRSVILPVMSQWIVTAVGPDRPGIVGELTGHLHAAGANLLDSRMVNLRGQFALVLLLDAPDAAGNEIVRALPDHGKKIGLQLAVTPQGQAPAKAAGVPFRLKTYSTDQPGIVHRISNLLQTHGV